MVLPEIPTDWNIAVNLELQRLLLSLLLSFLLGMVISFIYKKTNRGFSYESSFAYTLVLITIIITSIMVTIGSNVALSLGLIGSLSIIRFRTAIKNSIDMAFLFWTIAIGLASGAQNYQVAVITTITLGVIILLLNKWKIFFRANSDYIAIIQSAPKQNVEQFTNIFRKNAIDWRVNSSVSNSDGLEITYSIQPRKKIEMTEVIQELNKLQTVKNVSLLTPETNLFI
ncbi:hypothetical protein A3C28_03790 [Candidatus Roizmanbacteria bacterium RIFCSPHIGHO2_02_FULL_39_9]|uniref:DUF4956 domain-containing protein n=1 Tax=Candidatus Roizmanbacteria bacterium RIFCSPHIGHO2_02_FULL_39_9 TaxID=1802040 RepID=A0A1F7H5A4_9BACT|nr:MAG: hypothetical protein A3C28_03790 [Candidatus Roizmanbacteria bacterium RIFCSPHIGHO2_02_FULL_39_9]